MPAFRRPAAATALVMIALLAGCSTSSSSNQKVPSLYGRSATVIAEQLLPACLVGGTVDAKGAGKLSPGTRKAICAFSDGALTVNAIATAAERSRVAAQGDLLTKTCTMVGPGFSIVGLGALMLNHMHYTRTAVTYETTLHGFCTLRSKPPTGAGLSK